MPEIAIKKTFGLVFCTHLLLNDVFVRYKEIKLKAISTLSHGANELFSFL